MHSDKDNVTIISDSSDPQCLSTSSDNPHTSSGDLRVHANQSYSNCCKASDKLNNLSVTNVKSKTSLTRNPPPLDQATWEKYDKEYSDINKKSWDSLKKGLTTPEQFVTDLNGTLASFLESKPEFIKDHKDFFKHNTNTKDPLEEARKLKIELNKKAKLAGASNEDKINAKESIRMYSHMLKVN